ncbi:MAG: hypothetical protein ACRDH2_08915 [Anaerolineales bacterium]
MSARRIAGILLFCASLVVGWLGLAAVVPRYFVGELSASLTALGVALTWLIALPLAAGGVYMIMRGRQ